MLIKSLFSNYNFIIPIFIFLFIILITKFIEYYYKFYHIYKFLDINQKYEYFKNNFIVKSICKSEKIKNIVIYYFLVPVIKINYVGISLLISLLYSLCEKEFEQYVTKNNMKENNAKDIDNELFLNLDSTYINDYNSNITNIIKLTNNTEEEVNNIHEDNNTNDNNTNDNNVQEDNINLNAEENYYFVDNTNEVDLNLEKELEYLIDSNRDEVKENNLQNINQIEFIKIDEIDFGNIINNIASNDVQIVNEKKNTKEISVIKIGKKK